MKETFHWLPNPINNVAFGATFLESSHLISLNDV